MSKLIEAKIKALVDAMNATGGIQTVASCEGHWWRRRAPYIYFKGPLNIAQLIERHIRSLCWSENPGSNFDWTVSAQFNEQLDLTFLLHAPFLDRISQSTCRSIWTLGVRRTLVDFDLSTMVKVMNQIELGDGNVPSVVSQRGNDGHYK